MKVWLEKCIIGLYILVILIIIYGSLFFIRNLFTGSEPSAETLEAERIKWVADCELSPSCQNNEAMDESYKSAHPIGLKFVASLRKQVATDTMFHFKKAVFCMCLIEHMK